MLPKTALRPAALAVAALALSAVAASPALAQQKGTVIHITNDTNDSLTLFLEFKTTTNKLRHFVKGAYLEPGETMTWTAEPEYPVKRVNGKYLLRVRAFERRIKSPTWDRIEDASPDHWWGGTSSEFDGLKCSVRVDADGDVHLSARLIN